MQIQENNVTKVYDSKVLSVAPLHCQLAIYDTIQIKSAMQTN